MIWHAKSLGHVSNGCAGPFKRSREDPPQGTTGGERRGRVWKPHDHRRAASAPLESCHELGRSAQPLTGQQSAALGAQRPSRAVGSRSAGCRRSFSDEPPYRSQILFLFKSKGADSTGSLSDGPNPLLEDSFLFRRPFCALAFWPWRRLDQRRKSHIPSRLRPRKSVPFRCRPNYSRGPCWWCSRPPDDAQRRACRP